MSDFDPRPRPFLCPICLDMVSWTTEPYEIWDGAKYEAVDVSTLADGPKRAALLRDSRRLCPNPSGDAIEHHLPSQFGSYQPPIVIGFVGDTRAGKSHLLAALIAEVERGGLQPYRLSASAVDSNQHLALLRRDVDPLRYQGRIVSGTQGGRRFYTDALLIYSEAGIWPVAFFDVAGEDIADSEPRKTRFFEGVNGLIFVADPGMALGRHDLEDPDQRRLASDKAFDAVLRRMPRDGRYITVPTAIVVAKADRLRFQSPVDRWLTRPSGGTVDVNEIRAESRDAYAFLYQHGATGWLKPFDDCLHCTLHFVSATGGEARGERFPRGITPLRVLEPFIALLAMHGVLPGTNPSEVGL